MYQLDFLKARPAPRVPGAAAEEDERARRKKYAEVAGKLMSNALFRAMLRISLIAKAPIFGFFKWAEKQRSHTFTRRKEAVGPTSSNLTFIGVQGLGFRV